ncbi:cell envelope integrity protein TolA [Enterovirga aerilata]|uniref:Cell envelope integrity protein TolA n=1 Tax=Enterovirga aerilata TaxID=2730920 RepID=A0A849IE79_9HYPH|nr:cell envelope integrity protein TolA [Enterovirga sp. DB1703]NNM74759.1 cell envelope integrity protein TolA [Enterovirga sp. DB1703]
MAGRRDNDRVGATTPERAPADGDEYLATLGKLADDAIRYMDEVVTPEMEQATEYYRGDPLGNEEDGRSQVVMTEVRDVVQAMVPSLLRIFTGSERVVEFIPTSEEKVPQAEQATDAVNYLFYGENQGFRVLYNGFKDALVRKIGVLMWWIEHKVRVEELDYSDMTAEEVDILRSEEGVTILDEVQQTETVPSDDPLPPEMLAAGQLPPPEPLFRVRVRRETTEKLIRATTCPPEEFFVSVDALDEDDAKIIGRRRDLTVSQLVEMGYDEGEIRANMGSEDRLRFSPLRTARAETDYPVNENGGDSAHDEVTFFEAYVLIDRDGDGIAERRRIRGINPTNPYILTDPETGEPDDVLWSDEVPFGLLCPDPEPHKIVGFSIADQVMDLQEIKTAVVRNTLDSLANSIHPRTVIVEGQVNVDDALNTEVGAIIRARAPGMVQELEKAFVGQYSLPLLAYLDDTKSRRTGVTDGPNGVNADALQSSTQDAVQAVTTAAQERIEMIARIFAETGIRRLMRGLLRLAVQHSDKPRMVRLRNKWVSVDPRVWDADMDVYVNIGLGRGTDRDRLQLYMMIAAKQEQIIAAAGPANPLCNVGHLRNTYAKIMEIGGERDITKYFAQVDAAAIPANQNQQQPPDPTAILAQIEAQKLQIQAQAEAMKHEREVQAEQNRMALENAKLAQERYLKMAEIEARYAVNLREQEINAAIQRERDTGQITNRLTEIIVQRAYDEEEGERARSFDAEQRERDRALKLFEGERGREEAARAQQSRQEAA